MKVIYYSSASSNLWTPANVTTALWLDAVDSSTILVSNGVVDQLSDKKGNGRNFTSSGSARPLAGYGIDFDGVDDFLSASFTLPQPLHIYLVSKMLSRPVSGQKYIFGNGDSFDFVSNSSSQVRILAGSQLTATDSTQLDDSIYSLLYNGNSSIIRKNGTTIATGNVGNNSLNGVVRLGNYNGGSTFNANFRFYELVIAAGFAIDQKFEGYLAWKFNLVSNLASDHIYKSSPPTI